MDVDAFFRTPSGPLRRLTRWLGLAFTLRGVPREAEAIPLEALPCDRLDGAQQLQRKTGGAAPLALGAEDLVVSTLRMGYGHHRIARSVSTWALSKGATPWVHDLLELESPHAEAIVRMDRTYSRLSRWAAELGGVVDTLWGKLMTTGGLESLRFFCALAERLTPLMADLPRDVPVLCAHPLNAQIAVACGFRTVINLVIDNHPQHFVLAPGALNLVQGPGYEQGLRRLGMPAEALRTVGHWVPADILTHLEADTRDRLDRLALDAPRRLLVPIGGAGGQRRFVGGLIRRLAPQVRAGRARLLLNAGDHARLVPGFRSLLADLGLQHTEVSSWSGLRSFCREAHAGAGLPAATLFAFDRHDHGFAATDHLLRCADVLVTKPSELAFAPVPKLHIRRVGGHEAASALRSAELGDGTHELRSVAAAGEEILHLISTGRPLAEMNQRIRELAHAGVYSGSQRAVELALSRRPAPLLPA